MSPQILVQYEVREVVALDQVVHDPWHLTVLLVIRVALNGPVDFDNVLHLDLLADASASLSHQPLEFSLQLIDFALDFKVHTV